MTFERASGILLHPSSLAGEHGIGDLGPKAYQFVDWLGDTGCRLWQILPLGPTGYGDSPYQCFSAFAGNPFLISPEELVQGGFLIESDLEEKPEFPIRRVDFGLVIPWKLKLLQQAFQRFVNKSKEPQYHAFDQFCAENANWLRDYALFMAIKEAQSGGSWEAWPSDLKRRDKVTIAAAQKEHAEGVQRYSFYQFLFHQQWHKLRRYANERKIRIIGDLPIFVAYDSADVWSHPELFKLDQEFNPTVVAGVPPDFFSPTGQLWGNPLYAWEEHRETGYEWWIKRLRAALRMTDILRLDHFRGFAGYWEIPANSPTAETGQWVAGPGKELFRTLDAHVGDGLTTPGTGLPIIAEDLGVITPDVIDLRESFQLPGMKILQFGFTDPENPFLPHHYERNCVAYTGTHDNDTAIGWYHSATQKERDFALGYLNSDGSDFAWDLIRTIWSSVAAMAITPMQDVLRLGTEARMNYPSRLGGNWEWRMENDQLTDELAEELLKLNHLFSR